MKIDPSLPAFPFFSPECGTSQGLTIRAYFAAMAMQGMVSALTQARDANTEIISHYPDSVAEIALVYADALIAKLNKGDVK